MMGLDERKQAIHETIVDALADDYQLNTIDGIRFEVLAGDDELGLRLSCPMDHPLSESVRDLAYNVCTEAFSNSTNNDACDVTIRERTAHFTNHEDLQDWHNDVFHVIVDVHILDSLS